MRKIASRNRTSIWKNAIRIKTENERPILSRLMGVETEYAIRCKQNATTSGTVLDFDRLAISLGYETPIAPSFRNPYRLFLANGGCVSLETGSSTNLNHAMLESATPECHSPRELLCYVARYPNSAKSYGTNLYRSGIEANSPVPPTEAGSFVPSTNRP